MRTLVVVRHAKADRYTGVDDVGRPLLPRGRDDARAAGAWLDAEGLTAGLIVTSPARRAAETTEGLLTAYGTHPPSVVYEESVYDASLGDLLHVARGLDEDDDTVVLVGHNPSVSALVRELTGQSAQLRTCGIAVIGVDTTWADTAAGSCRLVTAATPRA